jgi:hypothetical protein
MTIMERRNSPADTWITVTKKKNRDVFSELDVLLKALDRFFSLENLPISREDIANRNFFDELSAVRDIVLRIIGLLDLIIPEHKKNAYWFQKFAQAKFLTDRKRDALREDLYTQDTPEKSLFLLYDSFINLKGIITDILKAEHIPYLTFTNIGQIIGRELRENTYFNPFKQEIHPEFDAIENREVSVIVKNIKEKETRKYISTLFLHLFKFLRYLKYADTSSRFGSLNSSLLVILLLRSEFGLFTGYLETVGRKVPEKGLRQLIKSIAYQFSIEQKRVFLQELREVFKTRSPQYLKGKIENSQGILKNLSEQSIVQMVQFFNPEIKGNEIFDTFITRLEQSLRLREDVIILQRFLTLMLEDGRPEKDLYHVFDAMRNYMLYFQSFTFKLLRHDDYEEFDSFFHKVLLFSRDEVHKKGLDKLLGKIGQFGIFVETCLRQISNRAELATIPVDTTRVENSISQYLQ